MSHRKCEEIINYLTVLDLADGRNTTDFGVISNCLINISFCFSEHVDDVRAQVQRAVKDLSIEQSLKTYDEVWLSKIFELRPHTRIRTEIDVVAPTNQVHGMGVKKKQNVLMVSYFESEHLLIAKCDYKYLLNTE